MRVKYIQGTSLVNYPRHIASVVFLGGCNWECSYCFNHELVYRHHDFDDISTEEVIEYLKNREKYIDGVVITGGEPLLDPNLVKLLRRIKENTKLKIKVDTNGSIPGSLDYLLGARLIDYVAMDIKSTFGTYDTVTGIKTNTKELKESIDHIKNSGVEHEFRTTLWKGHPFQTETDFSSLDFLEGENWYIQNFYDPDGTISEFEELTKKEVEEILEKLKSTNADITLRGDWY